VSGRKQVGKKARQTRPEVKAALIFHWTKLFLEAQTLGSFMKQLSARFFDGNNELARMSSDRINDPFPASQSVLFLS